MEREIRKRISTLKYLFLDFPFYRSIGKLEKEFGKLSLGTAVLHALERLIYDAPDKQTHLITSNVNRL